MAEFKQESNAEKRWAKIEEQTRGIGGHVTICSIEPVKFVKMMMHLRGFTEDYMDRKPDMHWTRRGSTQYILEPADPKTGWSILRVWPAYEMVHNPDKGATGDKDPEPLKEQSWHSASEIAQELVRFWSDVTVGLQGSRGVMIIADDVPSSEELKSLHDMQGLYQDRLIQEADYYVANSQNNYISRKHQDAAKARGAVRPWVIQGGAMKVCPNCSEAIYETALGCKNCGTNLVNYYEENFYTPNQVRLVPICDSYVAAAMEKRAANKAAAEGKAAGPVKPPMPQAAKA